MSDIMYIKNVNIGMFDKGQFTYDVVMPEPAPDECVVRSIIYRPDDSFVFSEIVPVVPVVAGGPAFKVVTGPEDAVFSIWSNISNDFIASFSSTFGVASTSNPQTRIWLKNPVPSQIQFTLYRPDPLLTDGEMKVADYPLYNAHGNLIINLDFIKYKSIGQNK